MAVLAQKRSGDRVGIDAWPAGALAIAIAVSIVILATLAVVIWLSFLDGHPGDAVLRYTLGNFADVFLDPVTYEVLFNTLGFSFVTLVVALAFGLPAAWLSERTDFRGKALLFALMTIGLLIPGYAAAMGWLFLLHPRIGVINIWLVDLFGLSEAPLAIATVAGMGWVQGLNLAPVAFVMTAAVFRAMDPALEESAQMSGANFRETLWRVTLPMAWPGILAASIYIFTIGFAAFDVPAIIGLSNRVLLFSTHLYLQLNPADVLPRYGVAAALSTIVIALAGLLSWWYSRIYKNAHRYQVVRGKAYRPNEIALAKWAPAAWAFVLVYFFLSKLIPLTVLFWSSVLPYFQAPSLESIRAMTFKRYFALPWELVLEALGNTGILVVVVPTVTLLFSLAISWIVLRSRIPGRSNFDLIAFLPHAVPNIIFGVGALLLALYVVEGAVPLYGTLTVLVLVFVVARVSYGTRMTNSGLIQIHHELEESARMSGARSGGVMARIVAPLLAPTLFYAWVWIALLTFRELTLAVLLTTRENITLPVVIWTLWDGRPQDSAAIAVVMLLLMTPCLIAFWFVLRRRGNVGDGA